LNRKKRLSIMSIFGCDFAKRINNYDTLVSAVGKKVGNEQIHDKTLNKIFPKIVSAVKNSSEELLTVREIIINKMSTSDGEPTPAGQRLLNFIGNVEISPESPFDDIKNRGATDPVQLANGPVGELVARGLNIKLAMSTYKISETDTEAVTILERRALNGIISDKILGNTGTVTPEFVSNIVKQTGISPGSKAYQEIERMLQDRNNHIYWNSYLQPVHNSVPSH